MKDLGQIVSKINSTPWLITEDGLKMLLDITERHLSGNYPLEEIRANVKAEGKNRGSLPKSTGTVGVLPLQGPIFPKANMMTELSGATSMEQWAADFNTMLGNDRIDSILLDVDSPGGSSFMIAETANLIREGRDVKPIYAVANTMACSAAYFLASQATELYASDSSFVGSVGVYMVHTDDSELQARVGVKETIIHAGRFKAALATPLTDETRAHLEENVLACYDQFVAAVADGRNTTAEDVMQNYGEGGVVSAKKAMDTGMVDGIRTFDEVLGSLLDNGGTLVSVDSRSSSIGGFDFRASLDKEKEHSEPGTGQGGEPEPRIPPEDEHIDDWKNNGGRLQRPPNIPELEDSLMDREQLLTYAERLGISDASDLSDEELATKVTEGLDASLNLVAELKPVTEAAAKQVAFAQAYPEEAEKLQKLEARDRVHEAATFANALSDFTVTEGTEEGGNKKETTFRLSTLAQETVKDSHMKLAAGNLGVDDLKHLIQTVATGGVEQGEIGSSRLEEYEGTLVSGNVQTDRRLFASKVEELMVQDGMERKAAMVEAAKRYPDLAQAYSRS